MKDGTLDKLHEHIQTAMGWTNSHLHHFKWARRTTATRRCCGENSSDLEYEDSTTHEAERHPAEDRQAVPVRLRVRLRGLAGGTRFCSRAVSGPSRGSRIPLCLEGARACPPEDVGGTWGYADFLDGDRRTRTMSSTRSMLDWVGGSFDPEAFDPAKATKRMRRGLPDWRRMA